MDLELKNKVVVVAGGSRGIGLAIARTLASEGCKVILNSRNKDRLISAIATIEGSVEPYVADINNESACIKMADFIKHKYGTLDILITNVGSGRSVPPGEETVDEWKRVIEINLFSATTIINTLRNIITKQTGSVLCVSSICGQEALGAPLPYSAAKAALNSYVKGISRVLGSDGIRINAVAPGNILDDGGTWAQKLIENKQSVVNMLEREVALKRLGKPEEIADFVTFLVSEKASFATGTVFTVDGGQVKS